MAGNGRGTPEPLDRLSTHSVHNQPRERGDMDIFSADRSLVEAIGREHAGWGSDRLAALGTLAGSRRLRALGDQANRNPPVLKTFDRFGRRLDEVEYHPAYHHLMEIGIEAGIPCIAWTSDRPGGHVVHAAMTYLFSQAEPGVCCPLTMTHAGHAVLRHHPGLAALWGPRVLSSAYQPDLAWIETKAGATLGMAMTEKQGGSDVRANATRAEADGHWRGERAYRLTGHKWFCSAPMSDAFLTLAQTNNGLSCFLLPRILPDGSRNRFHIQRLKDKLGNRANASAEVEYAGAWAVLVGEEGNGVRTIIEMVNHTRLDTAAAPAGLMRQALIEVVHHVRQRSAFHKRLVDQPLMRAVIADLALDVEASTALVMRVAGAFDRASDDEAEARLARAGVAIAKFWCNKRAVTFIGEAMECLGGGGYVEESVLPRLYREAPLNGIWEGSGNVISLDILRAFERDRGTLDAVLAEIDRARGQDATFDAVRGSVDGMMAHGSGHEANARRLAERLALLLQASLLLRHAPEPIGAVFCRSRLSPDATLCYGSVTDTRAWEVLIERIGDIPTV